MSVNWEPLSEIYFDNPDTIYWVVDTRDFHVNCISNHPYNIADIPDLSKLKKYPQRFFSQPREIQFILEDIHERSGGKGSWRFLSFKSPVKNTQNWSLKYLFIFKTDYGLLICDKDKKAIRKDLFEDELNMSLLNHQ